jgi:hypothetical protein
VEVQHQLTDGGVQAEQRRLARLFLVHHERHDDPGRLAGVACAQSAGQCLHRPVAQQEGQRDPAAGPLRQQVDDQHAGHRMAAEREEVVGRPDRVDPQHLRPDLRDVPFPLVTG